MTALLDAVGPYAPFVVFVLAAAEGAAFLGLFVPGEAAVVLGGVIAGTGRASLGWTLVAAVLGAVLGDSIGYHLGHRLGAGVLQRPRFATVARRMDQAGSMLNDRGWWALVLARFTSFLRAVVPFAAGMARMRYRRFLVGNVVGGVLWGAGFTLVGYFAGDRWPVVERWLRTGGLIVLGLVVMIAAVVWSTRWVARHPDRVEAWGRRLAATAPVRWLIPGLKRPARWVRPHVRLWPAALGATAGLWLFGALLQDVLNREEFFLLDSATLRYVDEHRIGSLVWAAKGLVLATQPMVVLVFTVPAAAWTLRRRSPEALALVLAAGGQWLIVAATRMLVDRPPPSFVPLIAAGDYGFPSEHMAAIAAVLIVALWPWRPGTWAAGVFRYGVAGALVALVGAGRIVLLLEYPSDTVAGIAVGSLWALAVAVSVDARLRNRSGVSR